MENQNHPFVPDEKEVNSGIVPPAPEETGDFPHAAERGEILPNTSDAVRNIPQHSECFGTDLNASAQDGKVPNGSEQFRTPSRSSDLFVTARNEAHTITVREAARMFEHSGVARTERSIVKWCQRDATGSARLDAYFDMNERRYYITEHSIQNAIAEEKAKAFRLVQNGSEPNPKSSEEKHGSHQSHRGVDAPANSVDLLRQQITDLRILNAGKDFAIKVLREERDGWIYQLKEDSKRIGELEARLLHLDGTHLPGRELPRNVSSGPEKPGEAPL